MQKKTLAFFRYTASAVSAIKTLDAAFLKANKRKADVDLFYGEHYSAERHYPHRYISAYFTGANAAKDASWMETFLSSNDLNQIAPELLN